MSTAPKLNDDRLASTMSGPILKHLLRDYVGEAIAVLRDEGEWPRGRGGWPDFVDSSALMTRSRDIRSLPPLERFLAGDHMHQQLDPVGYHWVWHGEVLPQLFLERVARGLVTDDAIDEVFDAAYTALTGELRARVVHIRQVTVVHGFPHPRGAIQLGDGFRLLAGTQGQIGYQLWELLGLMNQRQDVRAHTYEGDLLIRDIEVEKAGDGTDVTNAIRAMLPARETVLGALRLAYPSVVHTSATYVVRCSGFPLLPPLRADNAEARSMTWSTGRQLDRRIRQRLTLALHLTRANEGKARQRFLTAHARFVAAQRLLDPLQHMIDLVVSLEGLYMGRADAELRNRLALRVATVLGGTEAGMLRVFTLVRAAYGIRNQLGHGQASQQQIVERLEKLAIEIVTPSDSARMQFEFQLRQAASRRVQELVWRSLWAYAHASGLLGGQSAWPNDDAWDRLVFDRAARQRLRRAARITAQSVFA